MEIKCPNCGKIIPSKNNICECGFRTGCFGEYGYFNGCFRCYLSKYCKELTEKTGMLNPSRRNGSQVKL